MVLTVSCYPDTNETTLTPGSQLNRLAGSICIAIKVTLCVSLVGCTTTTTPKYQSTPREVLAKREVSIANADLEGYRACFRKTSKNAGLIDLGYKQQRLIHEFRIQLMTAFGPEAVDFFATDTPGADASLNLAWPNRDDQWWESVTIQEQRGNASYTVPFAAPLTEKLHRHGGVWYFDLEVEESDVPTVESSMHKLIDVIEFGTRELKRQKLGAAELKQMMSKRFFQTSLEEVKEADRK